jgi:hypothetical protein
MHREKDRLDYDEATPGRHHAFCTCGEWRHDREVDLRNDRDRIEVEAAWSEHQLQSLRG